MHEIMLCPGITLTLATPLVVAVRDIEKDRDNWKEEYERVMVENA